MESSRDKYVHQPLREPRSIRVLRLQSASNAAAQIRCRLDTVSLDDPPAYTALSYCWDAQRPSRPVACTNNAAVEGTLLITANCAAALRQLRDAKDERTLWIDSICIDQSSLGERSSQVALMGDIYTHADQVVVWLGEQDNATERAMRLLADISDTKPVASRFANFYSGGTADSGAGSALQKRLHERAKKLLKGVKSEADDKLGAFFRRSWFTRMWTIQEATLPSMEKIQVRCGDAALPWVNLVAAVDVLGAVGYRWGGWADAMQLQSYLVQMVSCHRFPEARQMFAAKPGDILRELLLSVVLVRSRSKAASDPKDKVLALYGLLGQLDVDLPPPDYQKTVAEIYAEVTRAAIAYDKSLLVLFHVCSDRRQPGLPSWVPDWSDAGWDEGDPRYPTTRDRFAAGSGADPQWSFPPEHQQLLVTGEVVDTVIYQTGSYPLMTFPSVADLITRDASGSIGASESLRMVHRVFETLREFVDVSSWADTYPSGEPIEKALQRTLVNDQPQNLADARMQGYNTWLRCMRATGNEITRMALPSLLGAPEGSPRVSRVTQQQIQALQDQLPQEVLVLLAMSQSPAWGFHSLAMPFCSNKTFFRTGEGYFGTAPHMIPDPVQGEDVIAVVAGLEMPVVLRPVEGGGYKLISHCYVHGIMYGEAWDRRGNPSGQILLI